MRRICGAKKKIKRMDTTMLMDMTITDIVMIMGMMTTVTTTMADTMIIMSVTDTINEI
jgi:hypothetical protein